MKLTKDELSYIQTMQAELEKSWNIVADLASQKDTQGKIGPLSKAVIDHISNVSMMTFKLFEFVRRLDHQEMKKPSLIMRLKSSLKRKPKPIEGKIIPDGIYMCGYSHIEDCPDNCPHKKPHLHSKFCANDKLGLDPCLSSKCSHLEGSAKVEETDDGSIMKQLNTHHKELIKMVLQNNSGTDQEILNIFISNGIPKDAAEYWVAKRSEYVQAKKSEAAKGENKKSH